MRDDSIINLSVDSTIQTEQISDICSAIFNRYQSRELQ